MANKRRIELAGGKYTIVCDDDGRMDILKHGKFWGSVGEEGEGGAAEDIVRVLMRERGEYPAPTTAVDTLRAQIAAQVLAGMASGQNGWSARVAVKHADALLAELVKPVSP